MMAGASMRDAVIIDVVRTPSGKGKAGGYLADIHPIDLLASTLRGLVDRTGIEPAIVDDVVGGGVTQSGGQGGNNTRRAGVAAGVPFTGPAGPRLTAGGAKTRNLPFSPP